MTVAEVKGKIIRISTIAITRYYWINPDWLPAINAYYLDGLKKLNEYFNLHEEWHYTPFELYKDVLENNTAEKEWQKETKSNFLTPEGKIKLFKHYKINKVNKNSFMRSCPYKFAFYQNSMKIGQCVAFSFRNKNILNNIVLRLKNAEITVYDGNDENVVKEYEVKP